MAGIVLGAVVLVRSVRAAGEQQAPRAEAVQRGDVVGQIRVVGVDAGVQHGDAHDKPILR